MYKFKIIGKITTQGNNITSNTVDLMEPRTPQKHSLRNTVIYQCNCNGKIKNAPGSLVVAGTGQGVLTAASPRQVLRMRPC